MKYGRTFNFSAGPAMMPEPVLEEIRDEMMNYRGSGMCVMEMSHRSKVFQQIIDEAEADLRELMGIPDNYKVGFFQGGATQQFAMVPLNFMTTGKADYIVSGNFSGLAAKEAAKFGEAKIVASSKDKNFTYIPDVNAIDYDKDASYIHICQNNTIFGTQYVEVPQVEGVPLVADMSSMILSKPVDVTKYGCIYFGVQNIGDDGPKHFAFIGTIAEIRFYPDKALTPGERAGLGATLAAKYGASSDVGGTGADDALKGELAQTATEAPMPDDGATAWDAASLDALGFGGFCGSTTWTKTVTVPQGEAVRLLLETGGHFTRVFLDGRDLGAVGWDDFSWEIPADLRGKTCELRIVVHTSLAPLFGAANPPGTKYWGATSPRACGLLSVPQWLVLK